MGLEVLKKGIIWRIGDGEGINIWFDPWISRDCTRKPMTPRGRLIMTEVAELIDPYTGGWDEELIRDTFWEDDVNLILALTIHQGRNNALAWHFDKHGVFSMKSAYKVARNDLVRNIDGGYQDNSANSPDSIWKAIWNIKCPGKIKHFLWRISHNSHPLRCNLIRKGMDMDTRCPVCNHLGEDGGHLFFKCSMASKVWWLLGLENERVELATMRSPIDVVESILKAMNRL